MVIKMASVTKQFFEVIKQTEGNWGQNRVFGRIFGIFLEIIQNSLKFKKRQRLQKTDFENFNKSRKRLKFFQWKWHYTGSFFQCSDHFLLSGRTFERFDLKAQTF
jgi:hypothetical protein